MNKNRKFYFNEHDNSVFAKFETNHEGMKNLMIDLAFKKDIIDPDGNMVSHTEAEDTLPVYGIL